MFPLKVDLLVLAADKYVGDHERSKGNFHDFGTCDQTSLIHGILSAFPSCV